MTEETVIEEVVFEEAPEEEEVEGDGLLVVHERHKIEVSLTNELRVPYGS